MNTLIIVALAAAINIIPQPKAVSQTEGSYDLSGAKIVVEKSVGQKAANAVGVFACDLASASGESHKCVKGKASAKGLVFAVDPNLAPEAYTIEVSADRAVVCASQDAGFLYALQSLRQMLPVEIYTGKQNAEADWSLPCCRIEDEPAFAYRGAHFDVSRHFYDVREVKRYLDIMATYKMNRLHWHLTDDQGWRIESKKYPRLAEISAWRNGTMKERDFNTNDNIPYGGYYTQDEIREVVAYADALGIEVIPEIDLPGHMVAVLAAYPEFGCAGGPYDVWSRWGVAKDVLCVGNEAVMAFLEDIVCETAELFPSEYFHIGGDECPKDRWKECPKCQAKIAELGLKSDEHATAEQRLQNYVTSRMQRVLAEKGKKIIGWDEILEGDLEAGATVMSWRGTKGGIKAARAGFDVIMTPNQYMYLDYCQGEDRDKEPLCIMHGYLPMEKVYSFNPFEGLDKDAAAHILGVQCNLWTEYIPTREHLEYMFLPRMIAVSEVQWSNTNRPAYEVFLEQVRSAAYPMLRARGYSYRKY